MVASIYGPLSAPSTHFTSEIGPEPFTRKLSNLSSCRRKLMFTQRIFEGESFYLDLRTANSSRQRVNLETDLRALGAKVEAFLSREVTHVVTDRNDAVSTPASLCSPTPVVSRDNGSRTSKASPVFLSRAQALLNRSVSKQQHELKSNAAATDPVFLAKQWGIRVIQLQKVLNVIEREKSKCDPNKKLHGARQTPKGAVRVRKLEGAYIKVEDVSCQYRPSSKNFPSFPVIDLLDPAICHEQSPFNLRRKSRVVKPQEHSSSTGKAEAKVTKPVHVVKETVKAQQAVDKGTPSTKVPVKKVPKSGFCEVCDTTYGNLKEHTKSDSHQKFALRVDNFKSLDDIISELPSLARLQSDFNNMTISSEAKTDFIIEPQNSKETNILPETKLDLNNGILSEKEKGLQTPQRSTQCNKLSEPANMATKDSGSSARSMVHCSSSTQQTNVSSHKESGRPRHPNKSSDKQLCPSEHTKQSNQKQSSLSEHIKESNKKQSSLSEQIKESSHKQFDLRGHEQPAKGYPSSPGPDLEDQNDCINISDRVASEIKSETCQGTNSVYDVLPTAYMERPSHSNEPLCGVRRTEGEVNSDQSGEVSVKMPSATENQEECVHETAAAESQNQENLPQLTLEDIVLPNSSQSCRSSEIEKADFTGTEFDEVNTLTPVKLSNTYTGTASVQNFQGNLDKSLMPILESVLVPAGQDVSEKTVMPKLTPQNTPLKNLTPIKYDSDMRVLSESAVQAVLKELNFLNTNYNTTTDADVLYQKTQLVSEDCEMPCEFSTRQDSMQAFNDLTQGHSHCHSEVSKMDSGSFPSMPDLTTEVSCHLPQQVDTQSNDATMPEPMSSRGSCFDVSPVKLISQFPFRCLDDTAEASNSERDVEDRKITVVPDQHRVSSCHSDAMLPHSVSESKSYPTSFSNILSGLEVGSSQVTSRGQQEMDCSNELTDRTLTEDQFCDANLVTPQAEPSPAPLSPDTNIGSHSQQTCPVQLTVADHMATEPMEFSEESSEGVENSIAQNLLARLQDQSFENSSEGSESATEALLHYNGSMHHQAAGSETMAQAAKELVNVDNVFCGQSVVCDSRSTATLHAPLDNLNPSPNSCSSVIPTTRVSTIAGENMHTTIAPGNTSNAAVLSQQWFATIGATTSAAVTNWSVESEPQPAKEEHEKVTSATDLNQNVWAQNAELNLISPDICLSRDQQSGGTQGPSLTFSGVLQNFEKDLGVRCDNPQSPVADEGRWSPSMILNPVSLWWKSDTSPDADQHAVATTDVQPGTKTNSYSTSNAEPSLVSPTKVKVVATKVHKKSKKHKRDKERSSHSKRPKAKASKAAPVDQGEIRSLTQETEELTHDKKKSKSHKHKKKHKKSENQSPTVVSDSNLGRSKSRKHKHKEKDRRKEKSIDTPLGKTERLTCVTPRTVKPVLAACESFSPSVTWVVTPSRGLKLKLSKVVTPLQEKKGGNAGVDFSGSATRSSGKHKHKKTKRLENTHRRRKLEL